MWLNIGNFEMSTLSGLLRDVVTLNYSCNMLLIPNIDPCKLCTIGLSMTEKYICRATVVDFIMSCVYWTQLSPHVCGQGNGRVFTRLLGDLSPEMREITRDEFIKNKTYQDVLDSILSSELQHGLQWFVVPFTCASVSFSIALDRIGTQLLKLVVCKWAKILQLSGKPSVIERNSSYQFKV